MKDLFRYAVLVFAAVIIAGAGKVYGQETIEALNALISRIDKEIRINQNLLGKVSNDRTANYNQLKIISSRIDNRKQLIASLEKQMNILSANIREKKANIEKLDRQLAQLRDEYAAMIRAAYKNYKLNNSMAFVFSASDFNDATRRINYMRRYNEMRERRAEEIVEIKAQVNAEIDKLNEELAQLEETKKERDAELAEFNTDQKSYQSVLSKLEAEAGKIQKQIKEQEAQKKKAQEQLSRIIAEENRKSSAKQRTEAEEQAFAALSGQFDQNKGKLPYPVRGGVIIDHFGTHKHPTQKNLEITNKGVNIAGEAGQSVYCVFDGEVTGVSYVNGLQYCVLVRHGDYLTIYANLESVSVAVKDKVKINQAIGALTRERNTENCYLHFELWQGKTYLNPEQWLKR